MAMHTVEDIFNLSKNEALGTGASIHQYYTTNTVISISIKSPTNHYTKSIIFTTFYNYLHAIICHHQEKKSWFVDTAWISLVGVAE